MSYLADTLCDMCSAQVCNDQTLGDVPTPFGSQCDSVVHKHTSHSCNGVAFPSIARIMLSLRLLAVAQLPCEQMFKVCGHKACACACACKRTDTMACTLLPHEIFVAKDKA